ncbi:hypothetical protein WOLCODRAFT_136880 [Wolfiporia cocos MD-104 SS10]|uniref:Uncharacterized protein n=1 Tax=Wolfiporia cocos (strain MD-104) TaxID=742152 RepID=A0A2H3JFX8_WOLCO|nr:hypothetical protein WOLCODRAFT_136880 [Wolfiporia cocos MD-104 SS10]
MAFTSTNIIQSRLCSLDCLPIALKTMSCPNTGAVLVSNLCCTQSLQIATSQLISESHGLVYDVSSAIMMTDTDCLDSGELICTATVAFLPTSSDAEVRNGSHSAIYRPRSISQTQVGHDNLRHVCSENAEYGHCVLNSMASSHGIVMADMSIWNDMDLK